MNFAVFHSDSGPSGAVREAVAWAEHIETLMPGVRVAEAHDELAGISDIAARSGAHVAAVEAWADGRSRAGLRPFPEPRQVVGDPLSGEPMNLYAWREVLSWLREVVGIDPERGIDYLSDADYAAINVELATTSAGLAADGVEPGWRPINIETESAVADLDQIFRTQIGMAATGAARARQSGNQLHFMFE
jgi:hypothetical protein